MSSGRLLKPLDLSSDKPPCSASAAQQAAGLSATSQWSWSYPPTGKFAAARALIPCIWNLPLCVVRCVAVPFPFAVVCLHQKREFMQIHDEQSSHRSAHLSRTNGVPPCLIASQRNPPYGKMHSPPFRAPATNYLLSCLRVSQNQPTREVRQRGNARLRQVHT